MFEDDSVDIACPKCGHRNSLLVREFEENAEIHFVCEGCKTGIRVDADEFQHRLKQVRDELLNLERDAAREAKRKVRRPRKGDFQI